MKFPALFRRRSLVLPTLVGWLLILMVLGLTASFVARNIASFLIVNEPVAADYLVIEGWLNKEELDQALVYFDDGEFKKAIIVGGPISNDFHEMDSNFAQRAADYLSLKGMPVKQMAVLKLPYSAQNRTYLNGVFVRDWFLRQNGEVANIDVFTSPAHTRRSRELYQIALAETAEVGVAPSNPRDFDPEHWWRSSSSGKHVAVEFAGWLMVKCCFKPGEPGSHFEKWGIEKTGN